MEGVRRGKQCLKYVRNEKHEVFIGGYIDIEGVPSLGVSLVVLETHEKKKQVEAKVLYKIEVAITVVRKAPYAMCPLYK